MALSAVTIPNTIQGAKGQLQTVCCQFASTNVLTGGIVRLNPALFILGTNPALPSSPAWQITYPAAPGVYNMTFVASDIWKNYSATLEVIDASTFRVCLNFFFVADLNDYIDGSSFTPNNYQIFENAYGTYSNVYTSQKDILLTVEAGGEDATCTIPVSANPFCAGNELNFDFGEGYQAGTNLEINVSSSLSIASNYFVGFYREDQIGNAVNFVDDLALSYAAIGSAVTTVADAPNNCILSGNGFLGVGGSSNATFTIDGNCLVDNACYRAYVVYQVGGEWFSCLSDQIKQTSSRDAIIGDTSCVINDAYGNTYNDCCLSNAPACNAYEICMTLDAATYNANLLAAGFTGTISDYFNNAGVFTGDSVPTGALDGAFRAVSSSDFTVSSAGGNITVCYTYQPNETFTGTKYIIFCYNFDFENDQDVIYSVAQISTVGATNEITAVFNQNGTQVIDFICAEETANMQVTYPGASGTCAVLVSNSQSNYQPNSNIIASQMPGTVVIDVEQMALDLEYCLKVVCVDPSSTTQPCNCDELCDCITLEFDQSSCDEGNGTDADVNFSFAINVPSSEVQSFVLNADGIPFNSTINTVGGSIVVPDGSSANVSYSAVVTLNNGCVYNIPPFTLTTQIGDVPGCELAIQGSNAPQFCASDCDCTPDPDCNNIASINWSCDETTGEITVSTSETLTSPVLTDDFLCSTDGTNYGPCAPTYNAPIVYITRDITFSDDCPDLHIEQIATCEQEVICQNTATLNYTVVGDQLTVTVNSSYGSPLVSEEVFVSVDGGANFTLYSAPITLTDGANVVITGTVVFSDGCPNIDLGPITFLYDDDLEVCNYDADYSVTCTYDDINNEWDATFNGDDTVLITDIKEYSTDLGATWNAYAGAVAGINVIFRWTIQTEGCCVGTVFGWCACNKPCCCTFQSCLFGNDFSDTISGPTSADFQITSFLVNGVQYVSTPINLGAPNLITIGAYTYNTAFVDLINSVGVPFFTAQYPSESDLDDLNAILATQSGMAVTGSNNAHIMTWPECYGFEIIVANSFATYQFSPNGFFVDPLTMGTFQAANIVQPEYYIRIANCNIFEDFS